MRTAILVVILCGLCLHGARAQGSKADYERALSLAQRTENRVFPTRVRPTWLPGGTQFWYRVQSGPEAFRYMLVDAAKGERRPAFDAAALAAALGKATGQEVSAERLTLEDPEFKTAEKQVLFRFGSRGWRFGLEDGVLAEAPREEKTLKARTGNRVPRASRRTGEPTEIQFVNRTGGDVELFWLDTEGARKSYGRVRPGQEKRQNTYAGHIWLVTDRGGAVMGVYEADPASRKAVIEAESAAPAEPAPAKDRAPAPGTSPDGRWVASVSDNNLFLRETASGQVTRLTHDGTSDDPYAEPFHWAPDSRHVVVMQTRKAQEHKVYIVESSPADQVQPKLQTLDYLKPGDRVAHPRPRLFDIAARKAVRIDEALFPNPWDLDSVEWQPDSQAFTFLYNQRGHQVLRLISVDATDGLARAVIDERSRTFIDYAGKFHLTRLQKTGEAIWMSERSGWCHLWLVDIRTGQMKNAVTQGEWVVRRVERVDEEARQVWFFAGGIRPGQDPYQLHFCRVNFDGTGLAVLTEGDGSHSVEFSPDRKYFLDTWSRPDLAPVIELRRSADGSRVCEVERADTAALVASGWTLPERFVAKGRDGQTDIHGILIKPSNFDPSKKYPVVEEVYAGPQGSYVPKEFGRLLRHHAIAELGFIVVQADGMGTSDRSKAFHDVCTKNLADAGFADRIAWIRAAAASRPWMDLGRVGIYGGSAGGQNAMRALIDHHDFYDVAVADCGCHDNRMDKIWWNELWLGWPVDEGYVRSSNVADAARLQGHLMLVVGEVDSNVDPASTMQVVNALEKADKDFDLVVMTGANHGAAETPYGSRRRMDFLVRHLHGREPRWTAD